MLQRCVGPERGVVVVVGSGRVKAQNFQMAE